MEDRRDYRKSAEDIFVAAVRSVDPSKLISNQVKLAGDCLKIGLLEFLVRSINNIYVIGAGKASAVMAAEIEKILGNLIKAGHIVVKYGHSCKLNHIKITEAAHPVPDANGLLATNEIIKIARMAGNDDLVICLISGGGSALLSDITSGCTQSDMELLNTLLINSGADINEINTVRKHLSVIKGGQLAREIYPASVVSLILSDVIGDALSVIASGPTVPDPTTFEMALNILQKYDLKEKVADGILKHLEEGVNGLHCETPKPGDTVFSCTFNILIGSNKVALDEARTYAMNLGFSTYIVKDDLMGDSEEVAGYLSATSLNFLNNKNEKKPICLLFGGETTVKMTGNGKGGRNQHLALLCSWLLQNMKGITILSAGTDGNDGPTEVAGAVVDSETFSTALLKNISYKTHIEEFNSYNFFKQVGGHIVTGPTMTNVMDIIIIIVE